jgi:hypothetical protein
MKTPTPRARTKNQAIAGMVLTVALAALIGGLSAVPARADNDDRGRNVQHERSQRERHRPHASNRYEAPRYVYAPPPVYYAPPPRRPAIDLVFPLHFR